MRRLMWFAIGFGLSAALCVYILPEGWWIPLTVVGLIAGLCAGILGRERMILRILAWALAGCALGTGWFLAFRQQYLGDAMALDEVTAECVITVTDYSWDTSYGVAGEGTMELEGKSYRVRFYINEKKSLIPGNTLRGSFLLRYTAGDESTHRGKGIFLLAYQRDAVEISHTSVRNLRIFASELRHDIQDILQRTFPEDTAAFAKALLLGDSSDLDYETDTAFKVSGIRHMIAVSGLHVSILYGLINILTLKRRYLTALIGVPVLVLFAAVAGFTPSVTRACMMVGLMMIAALFNREYDGPTELGFACLVMLVLNPMVITSVSFQLSVASVAGIFLFGTRIQTWLTDHTGEQKSKTWKSWLARWFIGSVSVTLSAISITTPLCAYYFGLVSLVGLLTNLLTLWAVSIIFCGIAAAVIVYLLWPVGAGCLAALISLLIRYVIGTAKAMAALPLSAVYTGSIYVVLWLVFVYILVALFFMMRKKKPGLLICCGVLGLCVALLCAWAEPLMDECRVTVLDVGQGQCVILQSEGKTFLVDCGGDYGEDAADIAADALLSRGISQLDGLILTHYDDDHAGGAAFLLSRLDADGIYLPDTEDNGVTAAIAEHTQGQILKIWEDHRITFGSSQITLFGPIYSGSSNENSLCILFETENCAILITGDRSAFGERMLLREHSLPQVDLLIAGHHGARTSTSQDLLKAVRPDTVIISVGENHYGHPSEEVLQRLEEYGCTVYRTDESGTIIYRR